MTTLRLTITSPRTLDDVRVWGEAAAEIGMTGEDLVEVSLGDLTVSRDVDAPGDPT